MSSGIYSDTIPNSAGCDSIISINLTVNHKSFSILSPIACNTYLSPSRRYTWKESGAYQDTIPNATGCDSIITINLTIMPIDVSVSQDANILASNERNASYQWIDCDNGGNPIEGETFVAFTAEKNGRYALIVTNGECIDTSACFIISGITWIENDFGSSLKIYPNPTKGNVYIQLGKEYKGVKAYIKKVTGELVSMHEFGSTDKLDISLEGAYGIYIVEVYTKEKRKAIIKIVKN
jgi:hypothetical protein